MICMEILLLVWAVERTYTENMPAFGTNGPLIIINKQSKLKESTERLAITKRCLN